jgi:hypothetical protein
MPKPGFLIMRSGSSSYYLMILEAMSFMAVLYIPGAGPPFLFYNVFLWVHDLNEDNPSFYCFIGWGSYYPGPGISYSSWSFPRSSVDPNFPRYPFWILLIRWSYIVFRGSYDPGPGSSIFSELFIIGSLATDFRGVYCFTFFWKLLLLISKLYAPGPTAEVVLTREWSNLFVPTPKLGVFDVDVLLYFFV